MAQNTRGFSANSAAASIASVASTSCASRSYSASSPTSVRISAASARAAGRIDRLKPAPWRSSKGGAAPYKKGRSRPPGSGPACIGRSGGRVGHGGKARIDRLLHAGEALEAADDVLDHRLFLALLLLGRQFERRRRRVLGKVLDGPDEHSQYGPPALEARDVAGQPLEDRHEAETLDASDE